MKPIKLYVVDDYLLTRIAHRRDFAQDKEIKILEDFGNAQDCIKRMEKAPADVVLMENEWFRSNKNN